MWVSTIAVPIATPIISVVGAFLTALVVTKRQHRLDLDMIDRQAETHYKFNALLKYREQVRAPMGQVLESLHDAGDRLYALMNDASGEKRQWTMEDAYYRRSFMWLLLRPLVWMEILRYRRTSLDLGLEAVTEEDQRFQGLCRLYELSLHRAQLFAGTGYDEGAAEAHVFAGDLRRMAEILVDEDWQRPISYARFVDEFCGTGSRAGEIAPIAQLVSHLGEESYLTDMKLARLLCAYVACLCILERRGLPFRPLEEPTAALGCLPHIVTNPEFRNQLSANIEEQIILRYHQALKLAPAQL